MRATSLAGRRCSSFPSSTTAPDRGASSRDRARNRVDLPHPLAPTIALIRPIATVRSSDSTTVRSPYARVTSLATSSWRALTAIPRIG